MHYIWHYYIAGEAFENIPEKLKEYNIPCEISRMASNPNIFANVIFEIEETHPNFQEVLDFLPSKTDTSLYADVPENLVAIQHYPVYSNEELRSAKWLSVRSSFRKVDPCNWEQLQKPSCIVRTNRLGVPIGRHDGESGEYIIKGPIKWGTRHFASVVYGEHGLFCDDFAKEILQNNQVNGIDFRPVFKKSTGEPVENIFRLANTFTVPDGAMVGLEYTNDYECEHCGMKMIHMSDGRCRFGINVSRIPSDVDFCRTLPLFSPENPPVCAGALILISQKMYRVIMDNHLNRALWFEPIEVVNSL